MLLWTKIKQKNLEICVYKAPSCVHSCKKHMQEGVWLLYIFFHYHNYQGGTGKHKTLILDNKQLFSRHDEL